jgi:glycyl-tRNA synthetase (class II)
VTVREYTPNVIEPSFGIGRILYSLLEHVFWSREQDVERGVCVFKAAVSNTLTYIYVDLGPLSSRRRCTHKSAHRALEREGGVQPYHPGDMYVQQQTCVFFHPMMNVAYAVYI